MKKEQRGEVLKSLQQHSLSMDTLKILRSSGSLGQVETARQRLTRELREERLGVKRDEGDDAGSKKRKHSLIETKEVTRLDLDERLEDLKAKQTPGMMDHLAAQAETESEEAAADTGSGNDEAEESKAAAAPAPSSNTTDYTFSISLPSQPKPKSRLQQIAESKPKVGFEGPSVHALHKGEEVESEPWAAQGAWDDVKNLPGMDSDTIGSSDDEDEEGEFEEDDMGSLDGDEPGADEQAGVQGLGGADSDSAETESADEKEGTDGAAGATSEQEKEDEDDDGKDEPKLKRRADMLDSSSVDALLQQIQDTLPEDFVGARKDTEYVPEQRDTWAFLRRPVQVHRNHKVRESRSKLPVCQMEQEVSWPQSLESSAAGP